MPISTGTQLDRKIKQGFSEGSLSTITAPWASNVERFLHQLIDTNDKQTFYITTEQTESVVADTFEDSGILTSNAPTILDLTEDSRPIQSVEDKVESVPDGSLVFIDSINSLETEDDRDYRALLNNIRSEISGTDTVVIMYGTKGEGTPPNRRMTYRLSDAVLEFNVELQSGDVETFIDIPKFRGVEQIGERIKIRLEADRITIDTSREIA